MGAHNFLDKLLQAEIDSGQKIYGRSTTVPTDGVAGWAAGAIYVDTDAADGSVVFVNAGPDSTDSANFDSIE